MPMHPLPILLNNGIPVVLCSDDPAVFGNMGLTYDFFQVKHPSFSDCLHGLDGQLSGPCC
jgi:adenosine deaminase